MASVVVVLRRLLVVTLLKKLLCCSKRCKRITQWISTWTCMIAAFQQSNLPEKAIQLFKQMQRIPIDPHTLSVVLAACADTMALEEGRRIHDLIQPNGNVRMNLTLGT